MAMRQTIFSSLAKREHLRRVTHVDMKTARFLEAKALVDTCKMARSHKVLQHSLSAATQLSKAVDPCKEVGLKIDAVATLQAANVLWDQGRGVPPIKMLQILEKNSLINQQSIVTGRAKLLAKLVSDHFFYHIAVSGKN
jgi:ataxia telangiectasia mutated family protein